MRAWLLALLLAVSAHAAAEDSVVGQIAWSSQAMPMEYNIYLADVMLPLKLAAPVGPITGSMLASRTSNCVSPCAIWFDATGTIDPSVTTIPFHELQYKWDFGDSGSGSWGDGTTGVVGSGGNTSRNIAYGPVAIHIFEITAGGGNKSKTVTLTIFDGANTQIMTLAVAITDPNLYFSGTATTCVANGAAPTPGVGGCPTGAAAVGSITDLPTAVNTYAMTNKRLLLTAGDVFTGTATAAITQPGPGIIGSFGAANNGKAILRTTTSTDHAQMITGNGVGVTDWRLMDLEFDGQSDQHRGAIWLTKSGNQWTLLRLYIHNTSGGFHADPNTAIAPIHDQLVMADSTLANLDSGFSVLSHNFNMEGFDVCARGVGILGTWFNDTHLTAHATRVNCSYKSVYSNNRYTLSHTGVQSVEMMGIRAPCSTFATCSTGGYFGAGGVSVDLGLGPGSSANSRYLVVSDNLLDNNTAAFGIKIGPSSTGDDAVVLDVLVERNYQKSVAGGSNALVMLADSVTVRNNIFDMSNTADTWPIYAQPATSASPAASNIRVYNNTLYGNPVTGSPRAIDFAPGTSGIAKDNGCYYPTNILAECLHDVSGGGVTSSNNSTPAQTRSTNPNFTTTPPLVASDFKPTSGYFVGGGTNVPVWSDFFLLTEPSPYDIGAVKH